MNNQYFLSIDCGGTKTGFLTSDEMGNIISYHQGPPANYIVNGLSETAQMLRNYTEDIIAGDLHGEAIHACFLALAGYGDIPSETDAVRKTMENALPVSNLKIGNDTDNAIAGSLLGKSGIHIVSGTGSIGIGIDLKGNRYRSGGWHHLFGGDEGSAYWTACRLLDHFTKQADKREEETILLKRTEEVLHISQPEEMLTVVIKEWNGDRDRIAQLAKVVSSCASEGDPVCAGIFEEAAQELALIIQGVQRQGKFDDIPLVSYSGGMFRSGSLLLNPLERILNHSVRLQKPEAGPLAGGILLAMDRKETDKNDEIVQRLIQGEEQALKNGRSDNRQHPAEYSER